MRSGPLLIAALALGCHAEHVVGVVGGGDGGARFAPACGPFASGNDLGVCTASYLSGKAAGTPAAVDVAADGALLVAATIEGSDLGVTAKEVIRGAAGALVRLQPDWKGVSSLWRVGDSVADMEVDPSRGTIVVLGAPFGVAALTPDGHKFWDAPVAGARVAVGSDGTVAVLDDKARQVHVYEWTGAARASFAFGADGTQATDVAVHGGSKTIVITGSVPAGALRQPFLDGYGYDGKAKWHDYGWSESDVTAHTLTASTTGVRVAMGRDDRLYYAGESHGGNTTHAYQPRDLAQKASLRSYDAYTTPYDVGPATVLFVARFRPADGALEVGQMHLARVTGGKPASGQSMSPLAIAADERGNVIVGGAQRCCMLDQDRKTVAGTKIASADPDADAFALVISADFGRRMLWTTFGRGGAARAVGVALAHGVAAMLAAQDQAAAAKAPLVTTPQAVQLAPGGGAMEAYLALWSAP